MAKSEKWMYDLAASAIAGCIGTWSTKYAAAGMGRLMRTTVQAEDAVLRKGPTAEVAAQRLGQRFGVALEGVRLRRTGSIIHYGLGASWAGVYLFYRRLTGMSPLWAGLSCGITLSLIVDEGVSPALGFTAPNRAFPVATHLRGFATHLVYGLVVAAITETFQRIRRRS